MILKAILCTNDSQTVFHEECHKEELLSQYRIPGISFWEIKLKAAWVKGLLVLSDGKCKLSIQIFSWWEMRMDFLDGASTERGYLDRKYLDRRAVPFLPPPDPCYSWHIGTPGALRLCSGTQCLTLVHIGTPGALLWYTIHIGSLGTTTPCPHCYRISY